MELARSDPYLAVALDDYGCPPACSGSCRLYAGPSSVIEGFLARLSENSRLKEYADGLSDAYRRYQAGDQKAEAQYCMTAARAFYPLNLFHTARSETRDWSAVFWNAWDCGCQIRADSVTAELRYAEMEGRLCRFVAADFQNAAYFSVFRDNYNPLWDGFNFWGHPEVLGLEGQHIFSRLAYLERIFTDPAELEADIRSPAPVDYSGFFFDVFGDG